MVRPNWRSARSATSPRAKSRIARERAPLADRPASERRVGVHFSRWRVGTRGISGKRPFRMTIAYRNRACRPLTGRAASGTRGFFPCSMLRGLAIAAGSPNPSATRWNLYPDANLFAAVTDTRLQTVRVSTWRGVMGDSIPTSSLTSIAGPGCTGSRRWPSRRHGPFRLSPGRTKPLSYARTTA